MTIVPDTSAQFFESLYASAADPWDFATSEYEQGRYQATTRALAGRRYRRAFEPGCSVGVLTAKLAAICDQVEALDISPTAVAKARERCAALPNVNVNVGALPEAVPSGNFDLLVLSEIGYYFSEPQLRHIVQVFLHKLEAGGTLIAVHWLGSSPDHVLSGDRVHEIIQSYPNLLHRFSERHTGFRLDQWIVP